MLSKKVRIDKSLVPEIIKKGKRFYSTSFVLHVMHKNGLNRPFFAVVVSKKTYQLAVDRNKARRRVYSILRNFNLIKPNYYIFSVQKKVNQIKFTVLKDEISKILS